MTANNSSGVPRDIPTCDVLIIGAGPSGLAAAIACERRGLEYEVLEQGVLVNSIYRFPAHMVFFTTPELLEVGNLPFVSPFEKPTRLEALRYYRRVVDTYRLRVSLGERVERIVRIADSAPGPAPQHPAAAQDQTRGQAAFEVHSRGGDGLRRMRRSRAAVVAVGYYEKPNLLDVPGEQLPHVSHFYTEAHAFYRQRVVVVGGANSAAEAALELYRGGASVTLVHRQAEMDPSIKYWVLPDIQNRIKEGAIAARFGARVVEITPGAVRIERDGQPEELPADSVFLLTGYHADREFLERCGIELDAATCRPRHDPETLETTVPNLFLAGGVMAGAHAAPIFIENGRLHGEKVVAEIARRLGKG